VRACTAAPSGSNALQEVAFRILAVQTRLAPLTKPPSRTSVRASCAFLTMSACSIKTRTVRALKVFAAKVPPVRPQISLALPAATMLNVHKIRIASPRNVILGTAWRPQKIGHMQPN